jgi:hypothetical protein
MRLLAIKTTEIEMVRAWCAAPRGRIGAPVETDSRLLKPGDGMLRFVVSGRRRPF